MRDLELLAIFACGLVVVGGCGVSADYVAVNAATIHTNSESTLTTLESIQCEKTPATATAPEKNMCEIKTAALDALKADQLQIKERAEKLCSAAKSDCKSKP